ncbi:metal ABC transporter permease [candidate division KSB1 bacterium]|nr:metal ABC transporter permease [candidate division KSB1 bacterium]MBL7094837.1 metal ABC transporter permease [candidate division KSB1 bacterium]
MVENLIFLAAPITACVLLAGILGYFGNHILSRGIIFIDIALAQIVALGTMIGLLFGFAEGSVAVQIVSLIFTLIIVIFFALTKFEKQLIPQEAIIGIIYGLGLGIATLFAEYIPRGSNYISKTITGNILWCTWDEIIYAFLLFVVIGIVHIFLGKNFIKITDANDKFPFSPQKVRIMEIIFYVTFGIVVFKAVPIAGIFLVFILLIAPTSIATIFTNKWKYRFIWSWIIGIILSVGGMLISYQLDISNGPAIVCLMGISVFILAFAKIIFGKKKVLEKVTD